MVVHCLFEQSGTFKNEFKKLGYEAYDYDIQNEFGETDNVVDLFAEIEGGYEGKPSIFDKISPDDLILAFFPCTRFEARIPLWFRGESQQQKNWTVEQKMRYAMDLHDEYGNVTSTAIITVPKGCCFTVSVRYIDATTDDPATEPTPLIEVQNSNLVINRIA